MTLTFLEVPIKVTKKFTSWEWSEWTTKHLHTCNLWHTMINLPLRQGRSKIILWQINLIEILHIECNVAIHVPIKEKLIEIQHFRVGKNSKPFFHEYPWFFSHCGSLLLCYGTKLVVLLWNCMRSVMMLVFKLLSVMVSTTRRNNMQLPWWGFFHPYHSTLKRCKA